MIKVTLFGRSVRLSDPHASNFNFTVGAWTLNSYHIHCHYVFGRWQSLIATHNNIIGIECTLF